MSMEEEKLEIKQGANITGNKKLHGWDSFKSAANLYTGYDKINSKSNVLQIIKKSTQPRVTNQNSISPNLPGSFLSPEHPKPRRKSNEVRDNESLDSNYRDNYSNASVLYNYEAPKVTNISTFKKKASNNVQK